MLYKPSEEIEYSVDIKVTGSKVNMVFSCDGGKHGADETLAEYDLTAKELLEILNVAYKEKI